MAINVKIKYHRRLQTLNNDLLKAVYIAPANFIVTPCEVFIILYVFAKNIIVGDFFLN